MATKFGLKVWSENKNYIEPAAKLYAEGFCNYIEIYALPETNDDTARLWKALKIPFIVHAPHFMHGLNFSDENRFSTNIAMAEKTLKFADILDAKTVIFHPGIKGSHRETARQIKTIRDKRAVLENKPYSVAIAACGLSENDVCVGYSPGQIAYIINETGIGFCLDIGHAICAANSMRNDKIEYLKEFLRLNPKMFHLSDGEWNGTIDKHCNIEQGDYDFTAIAKLLPQNPIISIETEKASKENLDDFKEDVIKLRKFFK